MDNNAIDSRSAGRRNEKMVLALLRKHGPVSQSRICQLTHLGSSTVSTIVSRLREKDLIQEHPLPSGKRGAKPVLISINPVGCYIIGAEINPHTIRLGLFDFHCELTEQITIPLEGNHSVDHVIRLLEINIRGLVSKEAVPPEKILGIGVTLSGSITPAGLVELSSPLGWKMVPLKQRLKEKFDWPIELHSTKVRLLAEIRAQPALQSKNIVFFNIADGVGSTLLIDGRLIHGATHRSGELGHMTVIPDGPLCGCGHRGCLEALISGPAILTKMNTDLAGGAETTLRQQLEERTTPEEAIEFLRRAVDQKDRYALSVLDFIREHLCRAVSIAVNLFDPDVLILAGYVSQPFFPYLAEQIHRDFVDHVYDSASRTIEILPARTGKEALIRGVAEAVFQNALSSV
jgi:predicted NBD/HSP70 family sugar kinase